MKAERRDALAARYIPRVVRLERRIAKLEGDRFHARAHREHLRGASIGELRVELRRSRRELRRAEAEQDRRAAMLYAQQGTTPWPVCGG